MSAAVERPELPEPPRRCRRCGQGSPAPAGPPVLTPDLVIAARQRAREPELPQATVEHALAASMPDMAARYDLIVLASPGPNAATCRSLAVEFARHAHRVFWLHHPGEGWTGPQPPDFQPVELERDQPAAIGTALASLRRDRDCESAAILVADASLIPATDAARRAFGWRRIAFGDAGAEIAIGPGEGEVDLAPLPSWPARWAALDRAIRAAWPRASVIVITFDNLAYNRMCLASLLENTDYPNLEIVVVDNGSTDGTVDWLREQSARFPHIRLMLNDTNTGFGPANNQAMADATGDIFVLLNNDTIVPHGWLNRLAHHLDDPSIGLLGPATNRTCNEAQVDLVYTTCGEFEEIARRRAAAHAGEVVPIRMLAMFCTALRRDLYERLGPLDERYEVGMFEDEDYAVRARLAGYRIAWAPEVYVHHAYHASIGKLLPTGNYVPLFRSNQVRFERKWGICWERHRPLPPS
ncbi:MAG: glycosyltransferase family 2 protein [Chloroflexota bacterium]